MIKYYITCNAGGSIIILTAKAGSPEGAMNKIRRTNPSVEPLRADTESPRKHAKKPAVKEKSLFDECRQAVTYTRKSSKAVFFS